MDETRPLPVFRVLSVLRGFGIVHCCLSDRKGILSVKTCATYHQKFPFRTETEQFLNGTSAHYRLFSAKKGRVRIKKNM